MKPLHYVIAAAPVLYGIAQAVKDFVPVKYAMWPAIAAAVAMYFMRAPKDDVAAQPAPGGSDASK